MSNNFILFKEKNKKLNFNAKDSNGLAEQIAEANRDFVTKNAKVQIKYNKYIESVEKKLNNELQKRFKKEYKIEFPCKIYVKIPIRCRFSKYSLREYIKQTKSCLDREVWTVLTDDEIEEFNKEYRNDDDILAKRILEGLQESYNVKLCVTYYYSYINNILEIKQFYLFIIDE